MITVRVEIDGLVRTFETVAESARDLSPALRQFGGYLRKKAKAKYDAQDFAPLAAATVAGRALKGLHSLEGKLKTDVRRALKRSRLSRGAPAGILGRVLTSTATRHVLEDLASGQSKGARNRQAVLAAFQRQHALGGKSRLESAGATPLTFRQQLSLNARADRAVTRQVGKPILGGLSKTLVVEVGEGTVTLKSKTHGVWSEAHNAGAVVGHGAKLPKRETVKLEADDLDVFGSILEHHLLRPLETEGLKVS